MQERSCEISVVIPTYNRANFIKGAIESVILQDWGDIKWECIIVNDGGTDNTDDIVSPYLEKDNFKYIRFNKNKGISASLNEAIRNSNGKYFCWLSDDDRWLKNKIKCQYNLMVEKKYKLIYTDYLILNTKYNPEKIHVARVYTHTNVLDSIKRLFRDCFINGSTIMLDMEVFDKIGFFSEKEENKWNQDLEYWFRIMLNYKDNDIKHLNIPLVLRTEHPQTASTHWCGYKNNVLFEKVRQECIKRNYKL